VALHIVTHPLVHDALALLRDKNTPPDAFRRVATRISVLLAAEALRDVRRRRRPFRRRSARRSTPSDDGRRGRSGAARRTRDAGRRPRAGSVARVGYIGLQRDERTAIASQYYSKIPRGLKDSYVLMIDPMLATGGSARPHSISCARPARPASASSASWRRPKCRCRRARSS